MYNHKILPLIKRYKDESADCLIMIYWDGLRLVVGEKLWDR